VDMGIYCTVSMLDFWYLGIWRFENSNQTLMYDLSSPQSELVYRHFVVYYCRNDTGVHSCESKSHCIVHYSKVDYFVVTYMAPRAILIAGFFTGVSLMNAEN
jgi:hypothetical protein